MLTENSEIIVDATVGTGGHAEAILAKFKGKLICIDKDKSVLKIAENRLARHKSRIKFGHYRFSQIGNFLSSLLIKEVSGFLFDLGLCSLHIDDPQRGFSFQSEGPLDMRMDQSQLKSALDVVNNYSLPELTTVLFKYGQERFSKKIARAIVNFRSRTLITTTSQLRGLVESVVDPRYKVKSKARVFQAIRMEVNDEMSELREGLKSAIDFLAPGGRLGVISFHSLEHSLIREKLGRESKGCICPPHLPVCGCSAKTRLRMITRQPIVPSMKEKEDNPRSRSAKLWVAEKLGQE